MQGEYRGDFTRDTFEPTDHFSRVLMQQGRVQVDADWNEQTSILLHYLRTLAIDLNGPHWGPKQLRGRENKGFMIDKLKRNGSDVPNDFSIGIGRYYVDGIPCENDTEVGYGEQSEFPLRDEDKVKSGGASLVYLDVWERHVTAADDPSIRETALGGPDTATRARVVWQVKLIPDFTAKWTEILGKPAADRPAAVEEFFRTQVESGLLQDTTGRLRAAAKKRDRESEPCSISPESRYRGMENHLYRVEIHKSGRAWNKQTNPNGEPGGNINDAASFKWSRDNSSVAFAIISLDDGKATLASLGRDNATSLRVNDWVEVTDDTLVFRGEPGRMRQVESIDTLGMSVVLKDSDDLPEYGDEDAERHPVLRRWDFQSDDKKDRALPLTEGTGDDPADWIPLEDGIRIQFPAPTGQTTAAMTYRSGDYWLIPARTATGDIEWKTRTDGAGERVAQALPPHGIDHHYAPLAVITTGANGVVKVEDVILRRLVS